MILQTSTKASENEGMGAKGGAKSPNSPDLVPPGSSIISA